MTLIPVESPLRMRNASLAQNASGWNVQLGWGDTQLVVPLRGGPPKAKIGSFDAQRQRQDEVAIFV